MDLKTIEDLVLFCDDINGNFYLFGHMFERIYNDKYNREYYLCNKCKLELEPYTKPNMKNMIIFESDVGIEYFEEDSLEQSIMSCEKRIDLQTIKNIIE